MSTLEVVCGRCDKKFRVRAEFAGRSTRCPGCSAPITIGSAPRPAPTARRAEEERPRPRPRSRDDEDDAPRRSELNWGPADMALRREQVAVICALLSILGGYFVLCAGRAAGPGDIADGPVLLIMILFGVGPSLAAAAFGLMARLSALGVPKESLARGSAVASLLCAGAGLLCLVGLAISILYSFESQQRTELPMAVSVGGLVLSGLAAVATFLGFVAQLGIVKRSAAVSRGVGRTAVTAAVCTLVLLFIAMMYTLAMEASGPRRTYGPRGDVYTYEPDHSEFAGIMFGFLMPIAFGVVLILYHRLLAAGRRAVTGDSSRRYDD